MTTAATLLLCWYLLSGFVLAAVCDVIFVKGGRNRLCFSRMEFALVVAAWPYYIFDSFWGRD